MPGSALGVGLVAAGAAAARMLAVDAPSAILLIGTAGSLPGGPPVGSVIVASEVGLGSAAKELGLGYVPRAPAPILCHQGIVRASGLRPERVLTNLAITTDPGLAARFASAFAVEHMEAFAVAWACQEAGVPFAAILGIANEVGPTAHAQWLRNRLAVQAATQAAAGRLLAVV
jgi:purine-nucleoside phosphorylase